MPTARLPVVRTASLGPRPRDSWVCVSGSSLRSGFTRWVVPASAAALLVVVGLALNLRDRQLCLLYAPFQPCSASPDYDEASPPSGVASAGQNFSEEGPSREAGPLAASQPEQHEPTPPQLTAARPWSTQPSAPPLAADPPSASQFPTPPLTDTTQPPPEAAFPPLTTRGPAFGFTETPSREPQPVVTITNADPLTPICFRFYGPEESPQLLEVLVPGNSRRVVTLARGLYRIEAWPLSACSSIRRGWAQFKLYTHYESSWVVVSRPVGEPSAPIAMGDLDPGGR